MKCVAWMILAVLTSSLSSAQQSLDETLKLFEYDASQSLDVRTVQYGTDEHLGVRISDINFVSPVAGRVTALLVEPVKKNPAKKPAGVVFLHWGQGDRSEFVWEAAMYARAGAVCISLDAPWNRPEPWKGPGESFSNPGQSKALYIQNIVDCRRAVDVLVETQNVDPGRIAYIGHSFGATQGGVLAGVEKRIKTFVLMGGLPSLVDSTLKGARKFDELQAMLKRYLTGEQYRTYMDTVSQLTPALFISHAAPSSVFMQFGKYDSWISDSAANVYFRAASEPKTMKWYLTGHEFTDLAAVVDRGLWLMNHIGIEPIDPSLREYIVGTARR